MGKYDHLERDALVRLLERRDQERQLGLVWERDDLDPDEAINDDYVALDLDPDLSHGDSPWPNLIIEGDNYDALRALRATHKGRIRCIYIDPPYNTGNRDFVYNDRFVDKNHRFRHSLWLEFMYKRLLLAKELLADDGAIFVSIDDNEIFHLGMLMGRVFGENNFVANVIWQKRTSPDARIDLGPAHDYIVVYSKNGGVRLNKLPLSGEQANAYKNPDDDSRGAWVSTDFTAQGYRPNQMYVIETPSGRKLEPPPGRCWANVEDVFKKLKADGRIWFGKDGSNRPRIKNFLSEATGISSWTWWPNAEAGHNQEAKKEILGILGGGDKVGNIFSTPKPLRLIERIVLLATNKDDTILDFFAGSGTTGHAILKLNAEDGGNRRFILVSNTEATEVDPDKNLCRDVCAERVRRVMHGYQNAKGEAVAGLGGAFAYLRARRVPRFRMSRKLRHAEIWHGLQLLHEFDLAPWSGNGFASRTNEVEAMAYLADFHLVHVERLRGWKPAGVPARVYSWAPERARALCPEAEHLPIPQTLRERFGK